MHPFFLVIARSQKFYSDGFCHLVRIATIVMYLYIIKQKFIRLRFALYYNPSLTVTKAKANFCVNCLFNWRRPKLCYLQ